MTTNPFQFLIEFVLDLFSMVGQVHSVMMSPISISFVIDLPTWLNDLGIADFNVGDLITSALTGMGITTIYNLVFGGGIAIIVGFNLIKLIKVW
jgi:hypothetical protein